MHKMERNICHKYKVDIVRTEKAMHKIGMNIIMNVRNVKKMGHNTWNGRGYIRTMGADK